MGDQVFDKWVANCNVRVVTAVLVQAACYVAPKFFPVSSVQKNLDELLGCLEVKFAILQRV